MSRRGGLLLSIALLPASMTQEAFEAAWKPLTFDKIERRTEYRLEKGERGAFVVAEASASASGLTYAFEEPVEMRDGLKLRWRWKVEDLLDNPREREKRGDDFSARIYVTFKYVPEEASFGTRIKFGTAKALYGEYPPVGAINYVWSSREEEGAAWPNPFAGEAKMLVVESGPGELGSWVEEERDLWADYRRLFEPDDGDFVPPIQGIAIMTDADNTGSRAKAAFARLELLAP